MSSFKTFELNEPLDMHLHLRDADMLKLVGPLTSKTFSGALVMPNLVPPITTKDFFNFARNASNARDERTSN
jgi:dihydroorotase